MGFSARQAALLLILAGTLVRVCFAASIGLGVDESYVAAVARELSLSYFDHPPLHFWLIWLTAHVTGSENTLVLRLPFIMLFAGTTWMMYRLGARLFGEWAGFYAALSLNLSAVFSLSTGSWLLPDGPLMFFMLATALMLERLFFSPAGRAASWRWGTAGFFMGLAMLAKYHAIFLAVGSFVFLLTNRFRRGRLLSVYPYMALGISFLVFLPVLLWNSEHHWASFAFQSSRGGVSGLFPLKMLANIGGQAAWVLPWIWLPLVWALLSALAGGPGTGITSSLQDRRWFAGCLAFGPIALFTAAALGGAQGLFHWQSPGYLFAFPLLGKNIADGIYAGKARWLGWLKFSAMAILLLTAVLGSHTATGWMKQAVPAWFASGDPSVEALNWKDLKDYADNYGLLQADVDFVVAPHWIDGGKVDYIFGGRLPVVVLDSQPHHFAFMHAVRDFRGKTALIIGRKEMVAKVLASYKNYFAEIEPVASVPITRSGVREAEVVIYRGRGFTGNYPLPYGL